MRVTSLRELHEGTSASCRGEHASGVCFRDTLDVFFFLRFGWFALLKWREQIDRDWEKRRGVMLTGNLAHRLQEA
jgi:hypothetical protein